MRVPQARRIVRGTLGRGERCATGKRRERGGHAYGPKREEEKTILEKREEDDGKEKDGHLQNGGMNIYMSKYRHSK